MNQIASGNNGFPVATTLLHSLESEQILLAVSLQESRRQLLDHLLSLVAPDDFFGDHHRVFWSCLNTLAGSGKACDPTALLDYGRSHNLFIGGVEYVTGLFELPLAAHASDETIRESAKRIKDFSMTRRFRDLINLRGKPRPSGRGRIARATKLP